MKDGVRYDRRVDDDFLKLFIKGGLLHSLARLGKTAAFPLDLQFRKDPKSPGKQWATLYAGLTGVLYVYRVKSGLRLDAHDTWSGKKSGKRLYGFRQGWLRAIALDQVPDEIEAIDLYLERVIPAAVRRHGLTEGAVQSVVSKAKSTEWAVLDREVIPSYPDRQTKTRALGDCATPLLQAIRDETKSPLALPAAPTTLGAECDLLALDRQGRVLAIEVKPMGAGTIAWVPAQAAMYARVLQHWVDADRPLARDVLHGMLSQRQAIGHAQRFTVELPTRPEVVPVVVLQRGAGGAAKKQMTFVKRIIDQRSGVAPVEAYEVSVLGDVTPLA